ncbi:hypothetical protein PP175_05415 [Aneurinibacillus sp. Ricciae_BoGa-3]|uniref:hypothetical protein n=1 Tax=Aneurinibacillus sp. Ricciae_BoGa-3 TaxID=3022697 RepID=UPI00234201DB|nr:hypothetical protein [Aneurinibacillus sp. Ricciae_BoGa-3]WCK55391.1 hypothetical protein PP175_05415 [Aneurinibacillus sp. Ricciae_BoGa-3]
MKRQLDPIAESSILLKEKCSEVINLPASPQKLQELDKLERYASSFVEHIQREKGGEPNGCY